MAIVQRVNFTIRYKNQYLDIRYFSIITQHYPAYGSTRACDGSARFKATSRQFSRNLVSQKTIQLHLSQQLCGSARIINHASCKNIMKRSDIYLKNSLAVKKMRSSQYEKSCEIKKGGQEMAVILYIMAKILIR